MAPKITWPKYVNCHDEEQFIREKTFHDAMMKSSAAYVGQARFRHTALVAKMHMGYPVTVAEYVEFGATISDNYAVKPLRKVTDEERAATAAAIADKQKADADAKRARENAPLKESVGEVMARLRNSPDLRQKYIETHQREVEEWVLAGGRF